MKKEDKETPPMLLEILSEGIREGGPLPLGYYLMSAEPAAMAAPTFRAAPSTAYRSKGTHCLPFYKPISRCFRVEH